MSNVATLRPDAAAAVRRYDFYGPIHKGLRLALSGLLVRIGAADFGRPSSVIASIDHAKAITTLIADIRFQMVLSRGHLKHEDEFLHTALEARMPGAAERLEAQHGDHEAAFEAIEAALVAIEQAAIDERPASGRDLYLAFARFLAEDIEHMNEEETVTQPLLHALFTDAEIADIEHRLVASIPPAKMMGYMKIMIPAMDPTQRAEFLAGMRAAAPVEAFQAVIAHAARPTLSNDDWADLSGRLGLAA
jgi:hypothetical protein